MICIVIFFLSCLIRTSIYFCVLFAVKYFRIIFFIVLCGVKCHIISCQYSLYMLVVELSALIRPKRLGGPPRNNFRKACATSLPVLVFKKHDPTVLAEYINCSQQIIVALLIWKTMTCPLNLQSIYHRFV